MRHLDAVLHLVVADIHFDRGLSLGGTATTTTALSGVAAGSASGRGTLRCVRGIGTGVTATLTTRLSAARLTAPALATLAAAALTATAARCRARVGHHQRHVRLDIEEDARQGAVRRRHLEDVGLFILGVTAVPTQAGASDVAARNATR